jgi:hypothetical protein
MELNRLQVSTCCCQLPNNHSATSTVKDQAVLPIINDETIGSTLDGNTRCKNAVMMTMSSNMNWLKRLSSIVAA